MERHWPLGWNPFRHFLQAIGADTRAKYISFRCADDYYTSIDMATALHPQTLLALTWDNQILPPEYGYPMKLRIPTKLGYKNPKHIQVIEITNRFPAVTGKTRVTTGLVAVNTTT
jgi:DMSO/TMAO reductase YedYZ molybdopterin-dependent catalytic subunit